MAHISSYVQAGGYYNFILEIVHSGLGLGYDKKTKTARNPLDHTPLRDPGVKRDCLLGRVMIDVSIDLRARYPELIFSSCTRLADVVTPDGEYKANHITSKLQKFPTGERGLANKIRAIHGGLYP